MKVYLVATIISIIFHLVLFGSWKSSRKIETTKVEAPIIKIKKVNISKVSFFSEKVAQAKGNLLDRKKQSSKKKELSEQDKIESNSALEGVLSPKYPWLSRKRGEEGKVTVEISVSVTGKVTQSVILESSGYERLDQAAIEAVKKANYKPALKKGIAIPSKLILNVLFKLK